MQLIQMLGIVWYLGIFLIYGCKSDPLEQVVKGNEKFTVDVYKQLASKDGNIIFSGLSAEIVLSLLTDGAKGDTQSQLITGLNLPNSQKDRDDAFKQITTNLKINTDDLKLLSANKIYPAKGFQIAADFKNTAVDVYKSGVENLDYTNAQAASETINKFVSDQTNDRIQNLVSPDQLTPDIKLVLVNALYLSGKWKHPFEDYNTKPRPFYTSQTQSKQIDTMYTEAFARYRRCGQLKAQFLEMDLKGDVSMGFILPDSKTGLTAVAKDLQKYLEPHDMESARVAITLPKFSATLTINFIPILNQLGITKVFTNQADLSGISSGGNLMVSFVVQKAYINVTESGVEAAAATAVGVGLTAVLEPPKIKYRFTADHPFFYYIKDKTGMILFAGRFSG